MSNEKILVTGATGTVGSEVVRALVARGADVRVGVRSPDKAPEGVEAVRLDYAEPGTLTAAFAGVDRVFLLTSFVDHDPEQVEAAVGAAKAAGVKLIVRMSAVGADPESPLALGRKHARCEQIVKDSGIDWVVLQPNFFQDNFVTFQLGSILGQGQLYGASKGGKSSYISSRDIGEVAAAILVDPAAHSGQTYVLTGPEAVRDAEVAELLTKVAGKPVQYVDLPAEAYAKGLSDSGAPDWMTDALTGLENVKAQGWAEAVSPVVEQVLGRSGERIQDFLERHRSTLRGR